MTKAQTAFPDFSSPLELYRQVYKNTPAGLTIGMLFKGSMKVLRNTDLPQNWGDKEVVTITVSSIVEGVEECTPVHEIKCAGKPSYTIAEEFWAAVEQANQEAIDIWNETHGCEECAKHQNMEYITGNTPVWLECPECKGGGEII